LPDDAHLTIDIVSPAGEPTHPRSNAASFVTQCGVLVRDHIPISIREWKPKKEEGVTFVTDEDKNYLWQLLSSKFTLPQLATTDLTKELEAKVKHWALKKMAQLFSNHKKTLYKNYIKEKKAPEFTGPP